MLKIILFVVAISRTSWGKDLPIILIAGIDSNCQQEFFVDFPKKVTNEVHCLDPAPDFGTWYTSARNQIRRICNTLDSNIKEFNLTGGFYFVGISQGGLWSRIALQSCESGKYAKRLITLGSPHMGVAQIPYSQKHNIISGVVNMFADDLVYWNIIQDIVGPAGYFHSLAHEGSYMKSLAVLPDYNNQRKSANSTQYRERVEQLEQFVMIMFSDDTVVIPRESAHFGYYKDASETVIANYTQVNEYKDLGLDELEKKKALYFYVFEGPHVYTPEADMQKYVYPHLK